MAVEVPCPQPTCQLVIEDAEHWEDARDKIRAHFRMEHPTKVLREHRLEETFETYNLTLDEYFESYYPGIDWRTDGNLTYGQINEVCRRLRRYATGFHPNVVEEAVEVAAAHGLTLTPFDPANPTDDGGNSNHSVPRLDVYDAGGF